MSTRQGPPRPTPRRQEPSPLVRFRCPKCGRREYAWETDGFDLTYEKADDTQHVGERLRVECRRCHYVGYEDCADAAAGGTATSPTA